MGKQVEVVAFGDTASAKLIDKADDFIDLGKEKGKFLIGGMISRKQTKF
jgi:uncharacterized LabA/DUF88 family protein